MWHGFLYVYVQTTEDVDELLMRWWTSRSSGRTSQYLTSVGPVGWRLWDQTLEVDLRPSPAHDRPAIAWRPWVWLVACVGTATGILGVLSAPTPYLMGGLLGSLAVSLKGLGPRFPERLTDLGQGVIGASTGALLSGDLLRTFWSDGVAICVALVATIALSLAWGQVLRLRSGVTKTTAAFASIAGGASGVLAIARDVGADEPVVATIQYLRVVTVLSTLPLISHLMFGASSASRSATGGQRGDTGWSYAFCIAAVVLGWVVGRFLKFPGKGVLLSMLVGAVLASSGWPDARVPVVLGNFALLTIGAQVGLAFTIQKLRVIRGLLPLALLQVLGTISSCAGVGYLLSAATGISPLDAYLATTPGGLYAVVAVGFSNGADLGFVTALQALRLFAALLMAPSLARIVGQQEPREPPLQ